MVHTALLRVGHVGLPRRSGAFVRSGADTCGGTAATAVSGLPARLARLTAWFPRPRFVDGEGTASDLRAVEGVNWHAAPRAVRHLDKAEPSQRPVSRSVIILTASRPCHTAQRELAEVLLRHGEPGCPQRYSCARPPKKGCAPSPRYPPMPTSYRSGATARHGTEAAKRRVPESVPERKSRVYRENLGTTFPRRPRTHFF